VLGQGPLRAWASHRIGGGVTLGRAHVQTPWAARRGWRQGTLNQRIMRASRHRACMFPRRFRFPYDGPSGQRREGEEGGEPSVQQYSQLARDCTNTTHEGVAFTSVPYCIDGYEREPACEKGEMSRAAKGRYANTETAQRQPPRKHQQGRLPTSEVVAM